MYKALTIRYDRQLHFWAIFLA